MHDSYIHGVKVPLQFVALNDKCQKVKNNSMLVVCYTSIFQSTISLLLLYLISKDQVVSKKMKKTLMPSLRSISKTLKKQVHHLCCPFMLLWESICSLSLVLIQEHSGGKLSTNGASDD